MPKLPYRLQIGHVVGSAVQFNIEALKYLEPNESDWIENVTHSILSHHGRLEWRSPVEPQTAEAFVLHAADMLSARSEG